jgi:hypothetical protein
VISGPESTTLVVSSCRRDSIVALQAVGVKGGVVSVAEEEITVGGQTKLEDISMSAQPERTAYKFLLPL